MCTWLLKIPIYVLKHKSGRDKGEKHDEHTSILKQLLLNIKKKLALSMVQVVKYQVYIMFIHTLYVPKQPYTVRDDKLFQKITP